MPRSLTIGYGLKRSGNHAVLHWLCRQTPYVFFNNVVPINPILSGRRDYPAETDFESWLRQQTQAVENPVDETTDVLISLEDHRPDYLLFRQAADLRMHRLIVLRSPENLFASRLKKSQRTRMPSYPKAPGPLMDRAIVLWKAHARAFLGVDGVPVATIGIYYDQWLVDPSYRRQICEQLGVPLRESGLGPIAEEGGGSSFAINDAVLRNEPEQLLYRRAQLPDDLRATLDQILSDDELWSLAADVRAAHLN